MVSFIRRNSSDSPKKSWTEYYKVKKASGTIRETYLEERAKEAFRPANPQEYRKLHTLLTIEKAKDRPRRLQFLWPRQKVSGVLRLTIETNSDNEDGTTTLREVEKKLELDTTSMREI